MKKKKVIFNIFCRIFICIMAVGLISPIVASAGTKEDYEEAQGKLDKINKEITDLANQKKKHETAIKNANSQIDLVKKQINILNSDIKSANESLTKKQLELEAKKADIVKTDDLFKERLKAMYVMRNDGPLSTLLSVDSFSELLTATDTLQRISVADTELLKHLDEEKRSIEEEEASIQQLVNSLVEKQGTLEQKQSELAGYMKVLDRNLSDTEAQSEAAKETQREVYKEYIAAKKAMEAEFGTSQGEFVGGEWIWPVPTNGFISSPFGWRTLYGKPDNHIGIDIATGWGEGWSYISNQPIVAANSGTVTKAVYSNRGYGNYIIIDHGGNNFTLYGHCNSLSVGVGDYVTQGQQIATVGSTGNSTGPHLHFEIRLNGTPVDPQPLVQGTRPKR